MEYVFYADVFWLQNSLMNGIVLLVAESVRKIPYRRCVGKTALLAGTGGLAETGLLVFLGNYRLYLWVSHFFILPLLVFLAFGRVRWKVFLQNILLCYGTAILLGGFVQAMENLTGYRRSVLLSGILGGILACACLQSIYRTVQRQKRLFWIELQNGAHHVQCEGLLDSGNLLHDPKENAPVHIVSPEVMQKLHVKEENCIGLIPYRALGTNEGILEIYRIDEISIIDSGKKSRAHPAVVARADEGLLSKKQYQIIVNPEILKEV